LPELPEVETVARQLDPLVRGRYIVSARIIDSKLREKGFPAITSLKLRGSRITRCYRSGKQIVIELKGSPQGGLECHLVVHLRMTGRLQFTQDKAQLKLLKPRAVLELDRGWIVFSDTRRFGTMRLFRNAEGFKPPGIDPLSDEFSLKLLSGMLAGSSQEIKAWLLRQDRLTGIGNIYACEALFAAAVDPRRRADSLSSEDVSALRNAIRRILRSAIRNCGTTFSDFQDASGGMGGYQRYLRVYGRAGESCGSCGEEIVRIVQQQRSTFFCTDCQK